MADTRLPALTAEILSRGRLGADDLLKLRRAVYADAGVSLDEAEGLFAIDEALDAKDDSFADFFVEAMTDLLVHQAEPVGYVDDIKADWLISRIEKDGTVKTASELVLLVRVLEVARSAPARLAAEALRQVAFAVLEGTGPLGGARRLERGIIGADEVELMRRILFAYGGGGAIGVTREEAEVLFDLNDRSREGDNHPAWSDLFVKAIASFLMARQGYRVPSRAEALRREAWLDAPERGVAGVFGEMMSGLLANGLKGIWGFGRGTDSAMAAHVAEVEADVARSETVTSEEVRWLADRIGRDGVIHANERALLEFLKDEAEDLHPSLQTLLDTAA